MNRAHIQEQRVYRKDLLHTMPTEVAGVPFSTGQEEQEKEELQEEQLKEVEEPFSTGGVEVESTQQEEGIQTQQNTFAKVSDRMSDGLFQKMDRWVKFDG